MKIVIWLAEGTWASSVDAAAFLAPADAEIVLLHVIDPALAESVHGAWIGHLGRGRAASWGRPAAPTADAPAGPGSGGGDPGDVIAQAAAAAGQALLAAAQARLGRPATLSTRFGRVEREVVAAVTDASMLILARDGDHTRLGPRSLGPATRFVVDHAPCRIMLVWPDEPPGLATIAPPPARPPEPPPPRAPAPPPPPADRR